MPKLLKVLGVAFGLAIIVGNTIGAGILRTPGEVAAALPSVPLFFLVWVVGGLYALLGAASLAELAVALPKSGGQYVYARYTFGEYIGFVVGCSDWISSAASMSLVTIALSEIATPLLGLPASRSVAVATVLLVGFTGLNAIGTRTSDKSQQLLSVLKVLLLVALVGACLSVAAPLAVPALPMPVGAPLIAALMLSAQSVIFTYDGWSTVTYLGGEMSDSARQVPRAMAGGVIVVLIVYLLLNIGYVHALGINGIAGEKFVAAAAARRAFGATGGLFVDIAMVVSLLGALNSFVIMTPRIPMAIAEDGLLPASLARIHRGGTPVVALIGSSLISLAFIWTGVFNRILAIAATYFVLQYTVSFAAIFVLRRREPDLPRPYRVIGYPFVPAIALIGSIAFLVAGFFGDTESSVKALISIVLSYPIFLLIKRSLPSKT
jgi:APA family basic amino acid/polyamine antiporter